MRALAPPLAKRLAGGVFREKIPAGERKMRTIARTAKIAAGGVLLALALYTILALPGLVSDQASTVPVGQSHQVQR